ncbi:MAG: hypothetical protein MI862_04075 [Desulfobacterales bacterium]|nr:hypothetical protein [Desulfobacterales bacterium]
MMDKIKESEMVESIKKRPKHLPGGEQKRRSFPLRLLYAIAMITVCGLLGTLKPAAGKSVDAETWQLYFFNDFKVISQQSLGVKANPDQEVYIVPDENYDFHFQRDVVIDLRIPREDGEFKTEFEVVDNMKSSPQFSYKAGDMLQGKWAPVVPEVKFHIKCKGYRSGSQLRLVLKWFLLPMMMPLPETRHQFELEDGYRVDIMPETAIQWNSDGFVVHPGALSYLELHGPPQKWRLSITQKDRLAGIVYAHRLAAGYEVTVRTEVLFEIKKGKYHDGRGKTRFVSIKEFSKPPGGYDCSLTNSRIRKETYAVDGRVAGKQVTLKFPKNNEYKVRYGCKKNPDRLRQGYYDGLLKEYGEIAKKSGKTLTPEKIKEIKKHAKEEAENFKTSFSDDIKMPLEYWGPTSGSTVQLWKITLPLVNPTRKTWGTPEGKNYLALELVRIE